MLFMGCLATATGQGKPTEPTEPAEAPRCWYVVPETVVPVNLNEVAVVASAASDPAHRKVTFMRLDKPMKVVTEFVATTDRFEELAEITAHRRNECAGRRVP
jgi:hypothetical protein